MQIKKFGDFTFVCNWRSNRSGFVHECTMFDESNRELGFSKAQYYNRTREPRGYYTVIRDCVRNYRKELLDRYIDDYKREHNKKRLFMAQKCRIADDFNKLEEGRKIRACYDAIDAYRSY